jgi:hypothetical protein
MGVEVFRGYRYKGQMKQILFGVSLKCLRETRSDFGQDERGEEDGLRIWGWDCGKFTARGAKKR